MTHISTLPLFLRHNRKTPNWANSCRVFTLCLMCIEKIPRQIIFIFMSPFRVASPGVSGPSVAASFEFWCDMNSEGWRQSNMWPFNAFQTHFFRVVSVPACKSSHADCLILRSNNLCVVIKRKSVSEELKVIKLSTRWHFASMRKTESWAREAGEGERKDRR